MSVVLKEVKRDLDALCYLDPEVIDPNSIKAIRNTIFNLLDKNVLTQEELTFLNREDSKTIGQLLDALKTLIAEKLSDEDQNSYFPKMEIKSQLLILEQNLQKLETINFDSDETRGSYTFGMVMKQMIELSIISRKEIIDYNLGWDSLKLENYNENTKQEVMSLKLFLKEKINQLRKLDFAL